MKVTRRRTLLGAGLAALPLPAVAQPSRPFTLRFVPESSLALLDPVNTVATATQNHAVTVYDTLYGVDAQYRPQPQMAAGHTVSDDGRVWRFTLRDGLTFHNGEPVRGADCVASLARWCRRDPFGLTMTPVIDAWESPDDRTFRIKLKQAFPRLLEVIARPASNLQAIMPEHVAKADPFTSITDPTGSGPFVFKADEYVSGSRTVYERFQAYVPRPEPTNYTAGAKMAYFDRIEWHSVPDASTAAAALQNGEVDWLEYADSDLLPMLAASPGVRTQVQDPAGRFAFLRFNTLLPPFGNPALRRAVLGAVDQADYLGPITNFDHELYRTCYSMFPCSLPFVTEAGAPLMTPPRDLDLQRSLVRQAGYDGTPVVILSASDIPFVKSFADVTADLLKRIGFNVDLQVMDWGTLAERRMSKAPTAKGGWNIFFTSTPAIGAGNPATNVHTRGLGDKGWYGWFKDDRIEMAAADYIAARSDAEQQQAFDEVQQIAFQQAASIPLGQFLRKAAFRQDISGIQPGWLAFPWNVRRAGA